MNKKDIIIVAALLNAATLAILFMLALRVDDDSVIESFQIEPTAQYSADARRPEPYAPEVAEIKPLSTDEVDDILRGFDALATAEVFPLSEELETQDLPIQETQSLASLQGSRAQEAQLVEEPKKASSSPPIQVPAEATPPAADFHIVEIVIKKGDILERIARANGTTVSDIKKLNQLKTERLSIGQVLRVPVGSATKKEAEPVVAAATAPASAPGDPVYYIIKSGDSPWKISKLMHIKMEELLELNQLDEDKARNLKIGDKIRIR